MLKPISNQITACYYAKTDALSDSSGRFKDLHRNRDTLERVPQGNPNSSRSCVTVMQLMMTDSSSQKITKANNFRSFRRVFK